jgi:hypothetical protein
MSDNYVNELEELREFLKEALLRMDPSLDVSAGSPAESEVITPTIERLAPDPYDTPIDTFIKERLRSQFPSLVMQDNDALDDYGVKINRVLLEPLRRQIQLVSKNQSLQDPEQLNEDEADKLGANFFVRRQLGGFAVGVGRLYYSAPQSIIVTPSNPVFTASGLRFFPVENQAINATNMQLNTEGGLYYFDVVVRAEQEGEAYNIDLEDGLVGIEGLSQTIKVENKTSFEEGADKESTEEYVGRVENSLAERSLVTARGINARLLDVFQNVRSVQVIGFGDIEMERDILEGGGQYVTYALFIGSVDAAGPEVDRVRLTGDFNDNSGIAHNFLTGGLRVGDTINYYNMTSSEFVKIEISEIIDANTVRTDPPLEDAGVAGGVVDGVFALQRIDAELTISGIPGGIIDPETDQGTISIQGSEVHIGGVLDVFVRAGFPQQRSTTVESIRDAAPLRFGVDLESFAKSYEQPGALRLINITGQLLEAVIVGGVVSPGDFQLGELDVLIPQVSDEWTSPVSGKPEMVWVPSDDDVGRFVQIMQHRCLRHVRDHGLPRVRRLRVPVRRRWRTDRHWLGGHCQRHECRAADTAGPHCAGELQLRRLRLLEGQGEGVHGPRGQGPRRHESAGRCGLRCVGRAGRRLRHHRGWGRRGDLHDPSTAHDHRHERCAPLESGPHHLRSNLWYGGRQWTSLQGGGRAQHQPDRASDHQDPAGCHLCRRRPHDHGRVTDHRQVRVRQH